MSTAGQSTGGLTGQVDSERATETRLPWIMTVYCVLCAVSTTFVALRIYIRAVMIRQYGIDDGLMTAAALLGVGCGLIPLIIMGAEGGLGRHQDTLPQSTITTFFKMNFVQLVSSTFTGIACVKLSVGFSLLRLIRNGWHPKVVWGTMAFVVAYTIMAIFTAFLYCKPLAGFWDRSVPSVCFDKGLWIFFAYFNSSANVLTDFIFSTLPIPVIWTLQLKRQLRVYLICIMGLGYLAGVCGIAKAACQTIFRSNPDQTYNNFISFFAYVELNIGIIAGCAPTLRPLLGPLLGIESTAAKNSGYAYPVPSRLPKSTHGVPNGMGGYVKTESSQDQYELTDNGYKFDAEAQTHTSVQVSFKSDGSRALVYPTDDRSSSEECILKDNDRHGIIKKTEVTVTRGESNAHEHERRRK